MPVKRRKIKVVWFICEWCPELAALPAELIHQPLRPGAFEREPRALDYPGSIVDIQRASRCSRSGLWAWCKREAVRLESKRILQHHVRPEDNGVRRGA